MFNLVHLYICRWNFEYCISKILGPIVYYRSTVYLKNWIITVRSWLPQKYWLSEGLAFFWSGENMDNAKFNVLGKMKKILLIDLILLLPSKHLDGQMVILTLKCEVLHSNPTISWLWDFINSLHGAFHYQSSVMFLPADAKGSEVAEVIYIEQGLHSSCKIIER